MALDQVSIVAQWNGVALEAVRLGLPAPTIITRALHIAHAAMYDAWAAYDADAVGAYSDQDADGGLAAAERAVSYAAHRALSDVFPEHRNLFDQFLAAQGLPATPPAADAAAAVGIAAAAAVIAARAGDGANQGRDYRDPGFYEAVNDDAPEAMSDPAFDANRWTPLRVPNGTVRDADGIPVATDNPASYSVQKPITPHWGSVSPFALEAGDQFRPVAPPLLGSEAPYTDATGATSTNDAAFRAQFTQVLELSAGLTAEHKAIAEYWADGPQTSTPPGHWNEFAHDISLREGHDLGDDAKFYFALNNALFDAGIAVWDAKYAHDFVRPQTAIRYLYQGQEVEAWAGPNRGTRTIDGADWQPYQNVTFVTPAFPEYTSGHSGFSYAAAQVIEAFTGSAVFHDGTSRGVYDLDGDGEADLIGSYTTTELAFEDHDGSPITLQWDTVWDAAAEAGLSRLYGGIHIQDGDLRGREIGRKVAETAMAASERLFTFDGDNIHDLDADPTDHLVLGDGANTIIGTPAALDGLEVVNFGADDSLVVAGVRLGRDMLGLREGSAILDIDADRNGTAEASIRLSGDFSGRNFLTVPQIAGTTIALAGRGDVALTDADERFVTADDGPNAIAAGGGSDFVLGGGGDDTIDGDEGDDALSGSDGDDILIGGGGADVATGGAGGDLFAFDAGDAPAPSGFTAELITDFTPGEDVVEITGYDGLATFDDLTWADLPDGIAISLPENRFVVFRGTTEQGAFGSEDILFGDVPHDVDVAGFAPQNLTEANDRYVVSGDGGNRISGFGGDDAIVTGSGDDALSGQEGDDVLVAGPGDDTLAGGASSDVLTGGPGADLFQVFGSDDDPDTGFVLDSITDFETGVDTVLLQGFAGLSAFADLSFTPLEAGIAADLGGGRFLVFEGVGSADDLAEGDFSFGDDAAPVASIALSADTGVSDSDRLTSDPGLSGTATDGAGLAALEVEVGSGTGFVDILDLLDGAGDFTLDRATLEARLGRALEDGTYAVTLRATDLGGLTTSARLSFTLDATAPALVSGPAETVTRAVDRLTLVFNGPLEAAAFDPLSYTLSRDEGTAPAITSVNRVNDQTVRLELANTLDNADYTLRVGRLDDAAGNMAEPVEIGFAVDAATRVIATQPTEGGTQANLDRKIVVEFDRAVDPASVDGDAIQVLASGSALEGRLTLSSNGKVATFFPEELLPQSTQLRIMVDGDQLIGAEGRAVDADGDGTPGGVLEADFSTVSLTRIPGTNIEGFIFDANYTDEDDLDIPLAGVKVTVVGLPGVEAVTDEAGRFFLSDLPAGKVYLDFDASGVTNRPEFDYGTIQKPVDTVAGETIGLQSGDKAFNIYFAALAEGDVVPITPGEETEAGIGEKGIANLTEIFPGIDPAAWEKVKIIIPPDSLTRDDGTMPEEVAVMAFEPDRIPAPLPPGFDPAIVFTVKAGDATNVNGKAQIEFPNIDELPLGAKRPILSFDHDGGKWVQTGTAIVVDDGDGGTILRSEGDSGINTLGWKAVGDEDDDCGGAGDAPMDPPPPPPEDAVEIFRDITYSLIEGDGEGVLGTGFFVDDPFSEIEFSAPEAFDEPAPEDDGCEEGNEDPDDERYVRVTINADPSILQFLKSTGNLDLSGGSHSFVLRPGDSRTYTLDFDPQTLAEMIPGGFKTLNENRLYSGDIVVITETRDADGNVTIEEDTHFLSRFVDATDDDHEDTTISFPRTIGDGAGTKMRELPLNFISGSSGAPVITQTGADSADFAVNSGTGKVTYDPVTGSGGANRISTAGFDIFNPSDTTAKAGAVGLSGKARNVQEVEVSLTEFTAAMNAFLAASNGPFATWGLTAANTAAVNALFSAANINGTFTAFVNAANAFYTAAQVPIEFVRSANDGQFINTDWLANDGNITDNFWTFGVANGSLESNDIDAAKIKALYSPSGQVYNDYESYYRLDALTNKRYTGDVDLYLSELLVQSAINGLQLVNAANLGVLPSGNLANSLTAMFAYTVAHEVGHHLGFAHAFDGSNNPVTSNSRNDIMSYLSVMNAWPPSITATKGLAEFALYDDHTKLNFLDALVYVFATSRVGNFIGQAGTTPVPSGIANTVVIDPDTGDPDLTAPPGPDGPDGYDITPLPGQDPLLFDPDGVPLAGGYDFGEVTLEDGAASVELQLINFGQTPIVSVGPDGGVAGSPFSIAAATFDPPLAFGEAASLTARFDAAMPGVFVEEVSLLTGEGTEIMATLSATAVSDAPQLVVTRDSENFGAANPAGERITQTVTVSNAGREVLELDGISIDNPEFTLSGLDLNGGIDLARGDSISFDVSFDPVAAGLVTGALTFDSNTGPFGAQSLVLNGTGLVPGAPADWGNDYVLVRIGALEFRTLSDDLGDFEFRLPTETDYALHIFDPETGMVADGFGTTAPAGSSTDMTSSLVFRATRGPDGDGDGLTDEIEDIIGSEIDDPDTNDDGVSDFDAVDLGFDPTAGLAQPTGIIGSVALRGEARDVAVTGATDGTGLQTAFLATGSHGLAVVDASRASAPILQAELDLDGTAKQVAADGPRERAYVAASEGGLHIVDISDRLAPVLVDTVSISGGAHAVVDLGGTALVGGGREIALVNGATGTVVAEFDTGGRVNDLAVDGDTVYAVIGNTELVSFRLDGLELTELGRVAFPQSTIRTVPEDKQVFVNEGVAYVANGLEVIDVPLYRLEERGGYLTFDIADPAAMTLISNIDTPRVQAGNLETVANGSGLALVAGGFRGLQVHDASDPEVTYDLLAEFATPGNAKGVALASGIAFVADGPGGLQVINVLPLDRDGTPPEVTLDARAADADPDTAGVQVEEGTLVRLALDITDDVQVRNVELILNGAVVQNDVSAPFDLNFDVPALVELGEATELSVQVRATDTGGNSTTTAPVTVSVIEDITPPEVLSVQPEDGRLILVGRELFTVGFSERIDTATLTAAQVSLRPADGGAALSPTDIAFLAEGQVAQVAFDTLPLGSYTITFDLTGVTDLGGNPVGGEPIVQGLEVVDATSVWNVPEGGDWHTAENWRNGAVPTARDGVAIVVDDEARVVINRDAEAEKVRLSGTLELSRGTFETDLIDGAGGAFVHSGGRLEGAAIEGGDGFEVLIGNESGFFNQPVWSDVQLAGAATVAGTYGGYLVVQNGAAIDGTLTLSPGTGAYSSSAGLRADGAQTIGGSGVIRMLGGSSATSTLYFSGSEYSAQERLVLGPDLTLAGRGRVSSFSREDLIEIRGDVIGDGGGLLLHRIDQAGGRLALSSRDDGFVQISDVVQNAVISTADGADVRMNAAQAESIVLSGPGTTRLTGGRITDLSVEGAARLESASGTGFTQVDVEGPLRIDGRLEIAGSGASGTGQLQIHDAQVVGGEGALVLGRTNTPDGEASNNAVNFVGRSSALERELLTFGPDLTVTGSGRLRAADAQDRLRFEGSVVGDDAGSGQPLVLARVDQDGDALDIDARAGGVRFDEVLTSATLSGQGQVALGRGLDMRDVTLGMDARTGGFGTYDTRVGTFGGLRVDGTLTVDAPAGRFSTLYAYGGQTVDGTGRIELAGPAAGETRGGGYLILSGLTAARETAILSSGLTIAGSGELYARSSEDAIRVLGTLEGGPGRGLEVHDLDNAGAAVTIDASAGGVRFGTFLRDTVLTPEADQTGRVSFVNGVDIIGSTLDIDALIGGSASQRADFEQDLTINGTLTIEAGEGRNAALVGRGGQRIGGTGEIVLSRGLVPEGAAPNNDFGFVGRLQSAEQLIFGPDLTLRGAGEVYVTGSSDTIRLEGRMMAERGELDVHSLGPVEGTLGASATGVLDYNDALMLTERSTLAFGLASGGVGRAEVQAGFEAEGTLALEVASDFAATSGDVFTILTATGDITGGFDAFTGFDLEGGLAFELIMPDARSLALRVTDDATAQAGGFIGADAFTPSPEPPETRTDVTLDEITGTLVDLRITGPETAGATPRVLQSDLVNVVLATDAEMRPTDRDIRIDVEQGLTLEDADLTFGAAPNAEGQVNFFGAQTVGGAGLLSFERSEAGTGPHQATFSGVLNAPERLNFGAGIEIAGDVALSAANRLDSLSVLGTLTGRAGSRLSVANLDNDGAAVTVDAREGVVGASGIVTQTRFEGQGTLSILDGAVLDDVTLGMSARLAAPTGLGDIDVINGLDLDGATFELDAAPVGRTLVDFVGSQSVEGTGVLRLSNDAPDAGVSDVEIRLVGVSDLDETLTLGAGIDVVGTGRLSANRFGDSLRILGSVAAEDGALLLHDIDNGGAALAVDGSNGVVGFSERLSDVHLTAAGDSAGDVHFTNSLVLRDVTLGIDATVGLPGVYGRRTNTVFGGLDLDGADLSLVDTGSSYGSLIFRGAQQIGGTGGLRLVDTLRTPGGTGRNQILFEGALNGEETFVIDSDVTLSGSGRVSVSFGDLLEIRGGIAAEGGVLNVAGVGALTGDVSVAADGVLALDRDAGIDTGAALTIGLSGGGLDARAGHVGITGTATLGGDLRFDLAEDFDPGIGEEFLVLIGRDGIDGRFASVSGAVIDDDRGLALVQDGDALFARVVEAGQAGRQVLRSDLPALPVLDSTLTDVTIDSGLAGGAAARSTSSSAVWSNVTQEIDVTIAPVGANLYSSSARVTVTDGLTIDGNLRLAPVGGSGNYNAATLTFSGLQTVDGSGAIVLGGGGAVIGQYFGRGTAGLYFSGSSSDAETLVLGADLELIGAGTASGFGGDSLRILGDVTARGGEMRLRSIDQGGGALMLDSAAGGHVLLDGTVSDAVLTIAQGADVRLNGARLDTVGIAGPGLARMGSATVDGLDIDGHARIEDSRVFGFGSVRVESDLSVDGLLEVAGTSNRSAILDIRGAQTVDGEGTLLLSRAHAAEGLDAANQVVFSSADAAAEVLTFGADLTLSGVGTVRAAGSNDVIRILGTIAGADGGSDQALVLHDVDQDGGTLTVDTSAGGVTFAERLSAAVLEGTGRVGFANGLDLDGVTLDMDAAMLADRLDAVGGGLTVNGTLSLLTQEGRSKLFYLQGGQTVGGTGRIELSEGGRIGTGANQIVGQSLVSDAELFTFGAELTIAGAGRLSASQSADSLRILGTLEGSADGPLAVEDVDNGGAVLTVDATDGQVVFDARLSDTVVAAATGQTGVVGLGNGLRMSDVTLNIGAEIGEYDASHRIRVSDGLTLGADMTLQAGAGRQSGLEFEGTQTLDGTGTIRMSDALSPFSDVVGNYLQFDGLLSDAETLTIGSGVALRGSGSVSVFDSGDMIDLQGSLIADAGRMTVEGHQLMAVDGRIGATAEGVLEVSGGLEIAAGGRLEIGIGADGPGRVEFTGNATLQRGGTLALDVAPGFTAELGDRFEFLSAGDPLGGDFAGYEGFDLAGDRAFKLVEVDAETLALEVTTDADAAPFIDDGMG